jgi:hypothetical protein
LELVLMETSGSMKMVWEVIKDILVINCYE